MAPPISRGAAWTAGVALLLAAASTVVGAPRHKVLKTPKSVDEARAALGGWLDVTLALAGKREDALAVHGTEAVGALFGRRSPSAPPPTPPDVDDAWMDAAVAAAAPAADFLAEQTGNDDVVAGQSVRQLAESVRALRRWNHHRAWVGIPPLRLDAARCAGPILHARYLVRNGYEAVSQRLGSPHLEAERDPWYAPEGRAAGLACNLGLTTPARNVDACMATFYHRLVLLDPTERAATMGWWKEAKQVCCVGPGGDRDAAYAGSTVVRTPPPDATDVPLTFAKAGERPEPVPGRDSSSFGYPITVTFYTGVSKVRDATIEVREGKDAIAGAVSTPEKPSNPAARVHHLDVTCAFLPRWPLRPKTTYEVRARAVLDGRDWDATWRFTTASPPRD